MAVVTCMDARLEVHNMLGIQHGDAHVIRNAGGIVTDDAVRSLVISHHLLGTDQILVINHTDCGMLTFGEDQFRARLIRETGRAAVSPAHFNAFSNLQENVREQLLRLRSHPWIPETVSARGFIYDVRTGRLSEVRA
jgi:carbonic anhydrase